MNRNRNIVVLLLGLLVLMCGLSAVGLSVLGGRFLQVATDPSRAAAVGAAIADFTVPEGYTQTVGFNLGPFKAVTLMPDTAVPTGDEMVFLLISMSAGDREDPDLAEQIKSTMDRQGSQTGDMVMIDQKAIALRGKPATITQYEDQGVGDEKVRQVIVSFDGKTGPAMLNVTGKLGRWDQAVLDDFLASMR